MGNICSCGSSEEPNVPPPRVVPQNISRPQEIMLHIPRRRVDAYGRLVPMETHELDRQTLETALTNMARFLDSNGHDITVVTVGGAVNTLLLQSRQSTHDVDFFGTNINNPQRSLLDEAAEFAERQSPSPLGADWFNNETVLWLSPRVHEQLTAEAIAQNEVVFRRSGLKLLAAPWNYAMCGKMNRLVLPEQTRVYDLSDAPHYLHNYMRVNGQRPVTKEQIRQWCHIYRKNTNEQIIERVRKEHLCLYRSNAIIG